MTNLAQHIDPVTMYYRTEPPGCPIAQYVPPKRDSRLDQLAKMHPTMHADCLSVLYLIDRGHGRITFDDIRAAHPEIRRTRRNALISALSRNGHIVKSGPKGKKVYAAVRK